MSVHVSSPLKGVHTFHHPGERPHLRATRCLGQVPSPPSCRSLHHAEKESPAERPGGRRDLGREAARALARPRPAGASPRGLRAAHRCFQGAVERSRAQAPPGTPGCCCGGEREKHRQLLLRQCFKRRFWLPLHFVRNLILSVCAVCSQHAYRVEARGAGAEEHLLSGAQSAGCEPEPRQRTGSPAPAWPTPVGSGSSARGGSPSPSTRTPPSTLPARAALHLRLGVELGRSLLLHQRLGCGWVLPCRQQQTG